MKKARACYLHPANSVFISEARRRIPGWFSAAKPGRSRLECGEKGETRMAAQTATAPKKNRQAVSLLTGRAHLLRVRRRTCRILEVEDTHFNFGSAVFIPPEKKRTDAGGEFHDTDFSNQELRSGLEEDFPDPAHVWYHHPFEPEGEPAPPDDGNRHFDDLHILAAVYPYSEGHDVLLAGHTDTVGSDADNQKLSEVRAKSIYCLLLGKLTDAGGEEIYKNEWYQLIRSRFKVEDYQCILTQFSEKYHWDCHPGPIDGVHGQQTARAVRNFQKIYNLEFHAHIPEDGVMGEKTWKAMFTVYMRELAELSGGAEALRAKQEKLRRQFLDEQNPVIGCGERYPLEARGQDNCRSKKNRRVEIIYFPSGAGPAREEAEDRVYKRKIYKVQYLSPDEAGGMEAAAENSGSEPVIYTETETPDYMASELNGGGYTMASDVYPEDEEDDMGYLAPLGNTVPLMNQKEEDPAQPIE